MEIKIILARKPETDGSLPHSDVRRLSFFFMKFFFEKYI